MVEFRRKIRKCSIRNFNQDDIQRVPDENASNDYYLLTISDFLHYSILSDNYTLRNPGASTESPPVSLSDVLFQTGEKRKTGSTCRHVPIRRSLALNRCQTSDRQNKLLQLHTNLSYKEVRIVYRRAVETFWGGRVPLRRRPEREGRTDGTYEIFVLNGSGHVSVRNDAKTAYCQKVFTKSVVCSALRRSPLPYIHTLLSI